jgi:hypothetical protein
MRENIRREKEVRQKKVFALYIRERNEEREEETERERE